MRFTSFVLSFFLFLSGCQALHTSVAKKDLHVETKMTDSLFLTPVAPHERTVFLEVRNTSDNPAFQIEETLRTSFQNAGLRLIEDPKKARFLLQANVLHAGLSDHVRDEAAFVSGFGGGVVGAAVGNAYGGSREAAAVGLLAGLISILVDAAVKDVTYSIVTDIQLSERSSSQQAQEARQNRNDLDPCVYKTMYAQTWRVCRTRVLSKANQANLKLEDAVDPLQQGLARSLSGLF